MQRERGVMMASSSNNTNFKIIVIYLEIVILLSLSSKYSRYNRCIHLECKIYVCAGVGGARFVIFPARVLPLYILRAPMGDGF